MGIKTEDLAKTSITHPLKIEQVQAAPTAGRIGITLCPGKKHLSSFSGLWDRDLDTDLDIITASGASAVVTLVEPDELDYLSVPLLGDGVKRRHMAWYHLPIRDVDVPNKAFEAAWVKAGAELRDRLRRGFDIVVHCKGGLGRAGTIAARLMVELGADPIDAINAVRSVRPGAIEVKAQELHVRAQRAIQNARQSTTPEGQRDRAMGALVGLAVGDAIGTTLEFRPRDSYRPLTDMVGGGPFRLKAGQWTDDTAMAMALADSLLACDRVTPSELMRRFAAWRDRGHYSATGRCFDIGVTTSAAISRWQETGDPLAGSTAPRTAGNGSLMRLAPVALRYWRDPEALAQAASLQSRTTHAASAAIWACRAFAGALADAIAGHDLTAVLARMADAAGQIADADIARVAGGSWRGQHRDAIRGSGYVVDSLEAALWSVARSSSFDEAVLTAANLGDDADTTAAIAGQLAGAVYGLSGIPRKWVERLAQSERIQAVGAALWAAQSANMPVAC